MLRRSHSFTRPKSGELWVAQIIHVNGIENLLLHFVFQLPKENAGFSCLDYSLQKPINPLESMGQLLEWDIIEQPALTDDDLYPINLMRNVARMLHKANVENAEVLEEARAKRVALERQIWGFDPSNLQLRIPNGTLPEPEQKSPAQRLPEIVEEQPGQLGM
ncbi:unnamed protein product, partial [Mesorhabditis spiculigera]